MKKLVFILFGLILFFNIFSAPAEFSVKEKSVIYTNSLDILRNYQLIVNQIGEYVVSNLEAAKNSSESFLELFVNRQVFLFNDIDPSHKLSQFYEAETYISNLLLWYPDGIRIELDLENARVGNIMQHEENVYSLDVLLNKKIDGNYLNQTLNKNIEELTFRIAFSYKNKSFENYKIVGIRSAKSNVTPDFTKSLQDVNSEELSKDDQLRVQEGLKATLKDYTNFLALLGDPQEPESDKAFYRTSFMALFQDENIKVYNDIAPDPENNLISVKQYLENYKIDYPAGIKNISMNTDSVKFGNVIKTEGGSLYSQVSVNKFFSGSYKDKEIFREMFPLTFKIEFKLSGKVFSEFKILSSDIATKNFFEQSQTAENNQLPEFKIQPVTRKGSSIVIYGPYSMSNIENLDFKSLNMETNNFTWKSAPSFGFSGGIGIYYFLGNHIAMKSGIEFNKFQSNYSLKGTYQDSKLSLDVNNSNFNKRIEANYDSLVTVNFLTMPVLFNYTSGDPGKFGFYFEAGPQFSYALSANSTVTGEYKYSGFYPYNPTVIQYLSLPELGFYSDENINRKGSADISKINFSVYGSLGINIPIGYFTSIQIGPEIIIGLSDIQQKNKEYIDIFGNKFDHQSTKVKKYGMRIGIVYKL